METTTRPDVLARFGRALSDPTRAGILLALRGGPCFPGGLADLLEVSPQAMSNHLGCLRGCGLVVATPQGRRVSYELADRHLTSALDALLDTVIAVDPSCR